ncbi:hypothetical protein [Streptomyces sp. MW-W600-10]|uniref:hypothetical protein n=1 Tax=Streptomyces sp. MW-W600-10 TaxID=2829819 RepID=UPI001C439B8B|nr:hypothetical protein [Streptomyces sp. MW-W600-10]MBV7244152.1 hypothetical protein [Streptomyces sp. MW-W600-10]
MDGAIIGLIGTAVGALTGVLGTLAAARLGGAEQRRTQNDQSEKQGRTTAYASLVIESNRAYRVGYATHTGVLDHIAPLDRADALRDFMSAAEAVYEAVSITKLHGPDAIARAADSLASALSMWHSEVGLLAEGQGDEQRASEAIELYEELEERFVTMGRQMLSGAPSV